MGLLPNILSMWHDINNQIVFDDGCTIKLFNFETAIKVDEFTEVRDFIPHFSAPEVNI